MEFFTEYGAILIIIAAMAGFFMAWGVGANDVANAMGTSVGSKALTIKQAILIAMVFEFAGAYLAGAKSPQPFAKALSIPPSLPKDPMIWYLACYPRCWLQEHG